MKIMNIGSLNIDYVYRVDDFVKSGETKSTQSRTVFAGGKGLNQSIAAARAGASVFHAGAIGHDGAFLKTVLEESGVRTDYLKELSITSGHTIIQVTDEGQNSILLYGGSNVSLTEEYIDQVLSACNKDDIVLLQNETNLTDYIISSAYDRGIPVAFNVSPLDEKALKCPIEKVKYIIVNELEGKALAGGETFSDILANLSRKYPHSKIVMTVGKNGVMYWDSQQSLTVKAAPVDDKIKDTTAAGDTFLGYYLASMLQGRSIKDALVRSSVASAIAIQREGASPSIPLACEVDQSIISLGSCENW